MVGRHGQTSGSTDDEHDQSDAWIRHHGRKPFIFSFSVARFVGAELSFLSYKQGCPGAGDDTLHVPLPYYSVPSYIASNPPNVTSDTAIDLVFVSFIESTVLGILNGVQNATNYTSADVSLYTPTLADAVLGLYAQATWN